MCLFQQVDQVLCLYKNSNIINRIHVDNYFVLERFNKLICSLRNGTLEYSIPFIRNFVILCVRRIGRISSISLIMDCYLALCNSEYIDSFLKKTPNYYVAHTLFVMFQKNKKEKWAYSKRIMKNIIYNGHNMLSKFADEEVWEREKYQISHLYTRERSKEMVFQNFSEESKDIILFFLKFSINQELEE